ncbi:MAG: response regulator [Terriglobales bacterium]
MLPVLGRVTSLVPADVNRQSSQRTRPPMQSSEFQFSLREADLRPRGIMSRTTVLLVEDNKIQKLANERLLHKAGYTVLNAADGEEALRLARETVPDIILLDMLLPKLGGLEVLRALRGNPPTARIPVLVFSSLPQANEVKLQEEGAAGYFEKSRLADCPAAAERALIELIEDIVRKSRRPAQPRAQTSPRPTVIGTS